MDYDENDFQNQNHRLASEGNDKFPPALNPYALPKFDFDDSLQGHLRFDSLVESEVFLGIESNDNRWIEDFSRGSCGIDFSKTAAESCPISRCNNVWSEATSSESVEMLLKSVVQEETIPRQSIGEVSDAFDELGCLTKRMDPKVSHDATFSELGDVGDLQPASSLEEVPVDSSGQKSDVGTDPSHSEVTLQTEHVEAAENNSCNLGLDSSINLGLSAEERPFDSETSIDVSGRDVSELAILSANNDGEGVTYSEFKADEAVRNSEIITVEDDLNIHESPNPTNGEVVKDESDVQRSNDSLTQEPLVLENKNKTNDENFDGDTENIDNNDMNQKISKINAVEKMANDAAADLDSTMETIRAENAGTALTSDMTESSGLEGNTNSVTVQESGEDAHIETTSTANKCEDVPLKDAGSTDQLNEDVHMEPSLVLGADEEVNGLAAEMVGSEQGFDSRSQRDHIVEKSDHDQLFVGELEGKSVASSYSMEEQVGDGDADRGMTGNVEVQMDTVAADTTGNSKVEISVEDPNIDDHGLSTAQAGTTELEEMNGQVDDPNPHPGSVCQEESAVLLPNLSTEDGKIDIPVVTDMGIEVLPISESGNTEDVDADKKVLTSAEVDLGSTRLDTVNNAEVEPTRTDLPTQLSESHVPVEEGSQSEHVKSVSSPSNEQSLETTVPGCMNVVETGNIDGLHEPLTAEVRESQECPNTTDVTVNLMGMASKGEECAEATTVSEKPGFSAPPCERESKVSGDASKGLENTLVSASPLPEGPRILDTPEDGRDHHNSDQRNSDTHIASGNDSVSVKEKEKGESEIFKLQDVGLSGAEQDTIKDGQHVPGQNEISSSKVETSSTLQIVEPSLSTPGLVQTGTRVQRGRKRGSPQTADKESRSSKGTPERKPRRPSIKSAGRESVKKGDLVKDARPKKHSELQEKSSNVSSGPSGIYQLMQPNEMPHRGQMEGLGTKTFGALTSPSPTLPDLNSSAFPLVFQQPFNDMQQVQLRAQILVYGSLISKLVPEELHMVSAFGGPDGGRSMWEKAWQTWKARLSAQTPQLVNLETPTHSRSDTAPDSASKQPKVTPSPAGRGSTSGTPRPSINPMIPLSSPLWSLPTPSADVVKSSGLPRGSVVDYQPAIPQSAQNQTQPMINYFGQSTAWMSQTPFRGPWAAPMQTPAPKSSIWFPSLPTESVQLTPVRESNLALSSGMKPTPPGPSAQVGVHPPSLDLAKVTFESNQPSGDPKSKKRKKGPPAEDRSRITLQSQSHIEMLPVPVVISSISAPVTATTPANFLSKCTTLEFNMLTSPTRSAAPVKEVEQGKKKPVLSEEAISKVKEARQQAEEAAALAAAAVSHSQQVWNALDKKKIPGSVSVSEAKLASAAAAIEAAAAVAKAAAAAANVASNAALQAKAMADEALNAGECSNSDSTEGNRKGGVGIDISGSIIFAAKEAARRRLEATSAAALRAENLDVIVKAAELAAEAISMAGKVITMDDPLSLRKLAEAGPEGFWKLAEFSSEQAPKVHDDIIQQANSNNFVKEKIGSKESSERSPYNGTVHSNQHIPSPASKEALRNPMEDQVRLIVGISGTLSPSGKDQFGQTLPTIYETASVSGGNPESQHVEWGDFDKAAGAKRDYGIQEGSRVEVFKEGSAHKGSWFSADVLSLKDGKAYVCYNELPSIKGSGKLQEWVNLCGPGDGAPKLRIPHPMTAVQFDGSKKRRRAAIGSFTCSVGDKVDAWIRDSWWEGVVTEKSEKDESSVFVELPVLGETVVVKAWHLRPSLIWKDGEWIEWSSSTKDNCPPHEGDTPKEKRAKLGSSGRQAKGKDKVSKPVEIPVSEKPKGSELLDISAEEQVFNVGKSIVDEGKPDSRRTIRSGLRKQGLGVVFGVPKPGKKRKFMDVSKHYGGDPSNNKAEVSDSVKLANYLMPRGTVSRGLRSAPRTDVKDNEAAESKAKVSSGRTTSHKYSSRNPGSFSSSEAAKGGSFSFSARATSEANISKKISAPKSNPVIRGKPASTGEKLAKIVEDSTLSSDSQAEPRRSVRRIQPTSRLLEGLQSSLIMSKPPPISHDKGQRSIRGGAKGSNQG